MDFAKESRYLSEEYAMMKCNVKIRSFKSKNLEKVVKEFIEIEEIGMFASESVIFLHSQIDYFDLIQCICSSFISQLRTFSTMN